MFLATHHSTETPCFRHAKAIGPYRFDAPVPWFDHHLAVDREDLQVRGAGDQLLAQQGAALALDDVEGGRLDLVGAVDRQVEAVDLVEADQGDAGGASPPEPGCSRTTSFAPHRSTSART